MKVDIKKIGNNGTELYINGVKYGENITKYKIIQEGGYKPILVLYCKIDELGFECDDVIIKKDVLKKEKE